MSPHFNFGQSCREFPVSLALTLLFEAYRYLLAWVSLRLISRRPFQLGVRPASFWVSSWFGRHADRRLRPTTNSLLTVHMIKHLLLMTAAPALILLGEPVRVFWIGIPPFARRSLRRVLQRSRLRRFCTNGDKTCAVLDPFCVDSRSVAYPRTVYPRHAVRGLAYTRTSNVFWRRTLVLVACYSALAEHLDWAAMVDALVPLLATLPCDILSGFLAFSDRVVYPVYFSTPRLLGFFRS